MSFLRRELKRVDRSFQTDARAKPARPDVGAASGALDSPMFGATHG